MKYQIKKIKFQWNDNYPLFASEFFLKSGNSDFRWIGGYKNENLKFVLPYKINKKVIFSYIIFTTSTLYIEKSLTVEDEKEFLNDVIVFFKKSNFDFIHEPPTYVVFNTFPDDSIYINFGSYVIDLNLSEEELWKNLHQKHRNVIRNAMNKSVKIENGKQYLNTAYQLYDKTLRRSGIKPVSFNNINKLFDEMIDNVEVFVSFYKDEPQGCAIIPYSRYSAYYIYGGSVEKPVTGAVNLLHWEAIKYFKNKGSQRYDFAGARINPEEGSKYERLQMFKSRFGGTLKTGYFWKMPLNKFKCNMLDILITLLKKSSIIDQEIKRSSKI